MGHKKLVGPESISVSNHGTLYTGLINGQIIRIDQNDSIHKVIQIGDQINEAICNDYGTEIHSHPECGRPLGLRLNNDSTELYVADSYYGLLKVDLLKGTKQLIFSSNDSRLGSDHMKLFFQNLYFPNGLQLTPEKDALLINENTMARIIKYYLTGSKKGKREIFVDLPGFGDTIRLTDKNTLLVPIAATRVPILELTGKYPIIRHLLGYVLKMRQLFRALPKYGLLIESDMNGNVIKSYILKLRVIKKNEN